MDYSTVSSSSIAQVGYRPSESTLGIRFRNGREYWYFDVAAVVFEELSAAESIGQYFNRNIRTSGYDYVRLR